ncbi:MAG: hypothetical protein WCP65_05045 [Bacteroidota bacterium]
MQTTNNIGILAYGSLINDPGNEIEPLIVNRLPCITPFNVEFARMSKSRDNAPTLIPVNSDGAQVNAMILVLNNDTSLEEAFNMFWRRETRKVDITLKYKKVASPGNNTVQIKLLNNFKGINNVIYTSIAPNLGINTPQILARLAIDSILSEAGNKENDGIRYLLNAKKNGIITPLSQEYERLILEYTHTDSLEETIIKLDKQRPIHQKKNSN